MAKQNFSHSEMWLWRYDQDAYVRQYIKGYADDPGPKAHLGQIIHSAIQDPTYPFVEEMKKERYTKKQIFNVRKIVDKVPTPEEPEYVLRAELDGVQLIGFVDGWDGALREMDEYKTTDNKDRWNQRLVDTSTQLSFYAVIRNLAFHDYFREMRLWRCNTATGTVKRFTTARGYQDVRLFKDEIRRTIEEIRRAGLWELRLSRKERDTINQQTLAFIAEGSKGIKEFPA